MSRFRRRIGLCVVLAAFPMATVVGCGDPLEPVPTEVGYSWQEEEHSLDPGLFFTGVCGVSENLVFVVGCDASDIIVKFENEDWTYVLPPEDDPFVYPLSDIHLHPSGYGYAVSREVTYTYLDGNWQPGDSNDFTAVWTDGTMSAWAVSADGRIWYLLGYPYWMDIFDFPGAEFSDIFRIGDEGFIVGEGGVIVHTIGVSYAFEEDSGTLENLRGVWGNAPDTVYAVGANGTVVRRDGEVWRPMDSGVGAHLSAVWGTSADDVFAVGEGGTILHYDGKSWTSMISGVQHHLEGVWGTSKTNVIAVGEAGTILRYGLESQ